MQECDVSKLYCIHYNNKLYDDDIVSTVGRHLVVQTVLSQNMKDVI